MKKVFQYKNLVIICYCFLLGLIIIIFNSSSINSKILKDKVLGENYEVDSNTVNITAFIKTSLLRFRVFPEKRIARIGNWGTFSDILLRNCTSNKFYTFSSVETDDQGYGTVPIGATTVLYDGPYRFYVRGISHLNRRFNCYAIDEAENLVDLTKEGKELLAGEVSVIYDNYINSLDMSVLVNKIFTNDYKSDLNQDSEVNSLDFSNQIFNLYMHGD
jgi:hypothetical protein